MSDFSFSQYVTRLYDEAVMARGNTGAKRAEVIQEIAPEVVDALHDGNVDLPDIEKMIADTLSETDNRRNRQRRFADLLPMLTGSREDETILDAEFDPWMQQAWALGGGIRKSGKYLTIPDGDAIMSNKRKNATDAVAAYESEADAWDRIKAIMRAGNHAHLGECK